MYMLVIFFYNFKVLSVTDKLILTNVTIVFHFAIYTTTKTSLCN